MSDSTIHFTTVLMACFLAGPGVVRGLEGLILTVSGGQMLIAAS
jgi:hypothetical protein